MVQFECPRHWKTCATLRLGEIHFPFFSLPLSRVIRIGPQYRSVKVGKLGEQNWLNRLQMVQFECPRHWKTCATLRLGEIHFPIFSLPLSGVIRIGPQYKRVNNWKFTRTKLAQKAANGPIWMPQALKNLCHTQVGRNPFSHFQPSPLWGNKNWPPV